MKNNHNWYKLANNSDLLFQLSKLDTRSQVNKAKANELILKYLNVKVGDILTSLSGMSSGVDKNYEIKSINPDFSVNLLAIETQRPMNNVNLYNFSKQNRPAWTKI